jgi:hypothetical protein
MHKINIIQETSILDNYRVRMNKFGHINQGTLPVV